MEPAPRDRPDFLSDSQIPLFTNPANSLGYIKIHKCGSNSFGTYVTSKLKWQRSWPPGRTKMLHADRSQLNPNPDKILVIVREPWERYLSGIEQIMGHAYRDDYVKRILDYAKTDGVWTKNFNQHVWPYNWFLTDWRQFEDRMEFVDVSKAQQWFEDNKVPMPPRHTNKGDKSVRRRLRRSLRPIEDLVRDYYQEDYRLLRNHDLY